MGCSVKQKLYLRGGLSPRPLEIDILAPWHFFFSERALEVLVTKALSFSDLRA